jgi:alpha-D-ribose 1-methylphosphonate 5-triphosphate synthase subunit PhnG
MKKSQISRILIDGDPKLLQQLSEEIEHNYTITVIKPPEKSLVMTKAIGGIYGFGILMGEDAERSYQLAVVDGAFQGKLPETEAWKELLLVEEHNILVEHQFVYAQAMKTKVNFDTMEEYNAKR